MGHEATTSEEDHALESLTARKFREQLPATEAIRFTRKGNVSGAGSWAANAVVTIAGHQYEEILGPSEIGGDRLPEPASLPAVHIMTLHHSDGSSEVLR